MAKIYICERCGDRYYLADAFFLRENSKGAVNKIYSALSYKYCAECLPYFEKEGQSPGT